MVIHELPYSGRLSCVSVESELQNLHDGHRVRRGAFVFDDQPDSEARLRACRLPRINLSSATIVDRATRQHVATHPYSKALPALSSSSTAIQPVRVSSPKNPLDPIPPERIDLSSQTARNLDTSR